MSATTPRMRMFAGPNGSGKSTLKALLPPPLLGVFLNPDELEDEINRTRFLDFSLYDVNTTADEVSDFFVQSTFLKSAGFADIATKLKFTDGRVYFDDVEVNSYFTSVAADFIRRKLLERRATFTFETVMSHWSKVELLDQAQAAGYRTYLYYVATDDPAINVSRVSARVKLKGHGVPKDRIVSRYYRSLDYLYEAIRRTHRAYIFDNSTDNADQKHTWLAEITDGRNLVLKTDLIPAWFRRAVLDKIAGAPPINPNAKP